MVRPVPGAPSLGLDLGLGCSDCAARTITGAESEPSEHRSWYQ